MPDLFKLDQIPSAEREKEHIENLKKLLTGATAFSKNKWVTIGFPDNKPLLII